MLRDRVLVTAVLLPIGLVLVYLGGYFYFGLIALMVGLAAWEFGNLFWAGGYQPARYLIVLGVLAFLIGRYWAGFASSDWVLAFFILISMVYHLIAFERGRDQAATDFAITLAGGLYLGWLGAYLISIRTLPNGMWWFLLALPSVWAADSAAYFYGRKFGKHKMVPRLSPKKSWEGYIAGIFGGVFIGTLFAYLISFQTPPGSGFTLLNGAIMGLVMSIFPTLGDLGESMIKRQVGIKDSSNILPGHGGLFDRIDSWLWGAVISYYLIIWFFI